MEKLFQEFKSSGIDEWVEQIYKDLKGTPKEILSFQPEFDLGFKSFYHRQEAPVGNFPNGRVGNNWSNRKFYVNSQNQQILHDLNTGVDNIGFNFTDQQSFNELTKDIQFEHIHADLQFTDLENAKAFSGHSSIKLNFDILSQGLVKGEWPFSMREFMDFYKAQGKRQCIWITGSTYGEAGSTNSQELAFMANHLNEYVQKLFGEGFGLEEINRNLIIELSVTEDFFANIAKFKLVPYITGLVFKAYDTNYELKPLTVYAKTSARFLSQNDHNNNLLRQTTMAMSALIGGCDAITIQTLKTGDTESDQVIERMAKNIPLILKEESHLDKVADASEGAYYMNQLCHTMIGNAWNLFKTVEEKGGLIAAAESSFIQNEIAKNHEVLDNAINDKSKTFLGVNKYPSNLEKWKVIPEDNYIAGEDFAPLVPYKLEGKFKKELHEQG